jgi:NAD(P)-dependent dehydrogenase (short-subunit alcohol dehydrogenase family)
MLPTARSLQLFTNEVFLVTGGGSGIGAPISKRLGREGAKVLVADLNEKSGRAIADEITAQGGEAISTRVDVADEASVQAMVELATKKYGRLDGAVNNAAITHPLAPITELDYATWDRTMKVTLGGTFLGMKHQIQAIEKGERPGAILNISSGASLRALPYLSAYSAAKVGVNAITKTAALEYASKDIRVNAICPGATATAMLQDSLDEGFDLKTFGIPLNRLGQPEDIANAAAFLLSKEASFITGQCLSVDGGTVI